MNISERILKQAVKLGGDNLYFFKFSMTLKDLTSIENITLDGQELTKVEGNNYLVKDANDITYGVIKRTSNNSNDAIALSSAAMFPARHSTFIEIAAENIAADGMIEAPGASSSTPEEESSISIFVPDVYEENEAPSNHKKEEFSVSSKGTAFHRALKSAGNDCIDVSGFLGEGGHVATLESAISHASNRLKDILKFEIGAHEYAAHQSVIDNVFNGVSAWLFERAQGDLARQKLDHDHKYAVKESTKQYVATVVTTLNSLLNITVACLTTAPSGDELQQILEERTIDLSIIVKTNN